MMLIYFLQMIADLTLKLLGIVSTSVKMKFRVY